jgi:alpha-galactosidase
MLIATYLEGWKERLEEQDDPELDVDLDTVGVERSEEYAFRPIHSIETDMAR